MATNPERLGDAEVRTQLETLPAWAADDGWLTRTYTTDGWATTLMLVNAIGFAAEAADHHPDLAVKWSSVTVRLQTHTADGITAKDIELARLIERTASWKPAAGDALDGTAREWIR